MAVDFQVVRRSKDHHNLVPTFPGYSQISEIGGGGFSTVYRATEASTGRLVALKVLRVSGSAPHVVMAFDLEVRALAALSSHPNIVTMYQTLTTADGRPVLVMELCRESIAHTVRNQGPLDARHATTIGIKIGGALETAHRSGLLHRDMKPQNVLITQYNEPALADFGVAALQASDKATEGILGFTMLHAAPEVLEGQYLSPATDVYGLASTLYQLLAGQAPFAAYDGETPASVILRILRDPVTPLRAKAEVPIALSDLLSTALAKDPSRRPVSALALAEALQQIEILEGWPPTFPAVWGQATVARPSPAPRVPLPASLLEETEPRPLPAEAIPPLPPPPFIDPADRGPAVVTPLNTGRRVLPPQIVGEEIAPPADLLLPQPVEAIASDEIPAAASHSADASAATPSSTVPRPLYIDPPHLPAAARALGPDYDDTLAPAGLAAAMQQTKGEPPARERKAGPSGFPRWWRRRRS